MDIEELIPHRGRMKLIDEVLDIDDDKAVTRARVSDQWPLCRDLFVDPIVLIEVVAQTSAVYISGKTEGGRSATDRRGWMVGVKNADFFCDRIPVDTILRTTVRSLYHIDQYNVIAGEVQAGDDMLCRVEIQVLRESEETA
ncbi:MAG: hypothetical protein PHY29_03870 [Syntrophales bacterium]|nr:hypothetical protein [Syntrophales bacterium]